ncbi:hypothetical protein BDU57DRAFT_538363 [Ampelomyces quisqualis]|uniref:F-box domain-containing protein n=1 Tax=Ampelomyces quisqualis TaxID=50730 RepID=A0A6A5QKX3_AMPQU|nr:hypothetical protein BDU57DRAFT_538363 [Ampelomyces quisqualis]
MSNAFNLLQLPPELRNTIYEMALTFDKSLHLLLDVISGSKWSRLLTHPHISSRLGPTEFNQLKYVNKQLYSEVALLELKFSDLVAIISDDNHPAEVFMQWLSVLHPRKLAWIKTVTLANYSTLYKLVPQRLSPD